MKQRVFISLMVSATISWAIWLGLLLYNGPQETGTSTRLYVSPLGSGVYRLENSEVICYSVSQGLQCKFK